MSKDKVSASADTVGLVPDIPANSRGLYMYRYTGEGYMPEGAKEVRASTPADAIRKFRDSLYSFGYRPDDEEPGPDDDCAACAEGTHICCHDCG
jgi:hypothetical protein